MKISRTCFGAILTTLSLGALAGCGDDSTGSGATGGAGASSSTSGGGGEGGAGGVADGGGGSGAGGSGGSGGSIAGADRRVLISVLNRVASQGSPSVIGFYIDNTGAPEGEDCHIEESGPCLVLQCGESGEPTSGVDLGHVELGVDGDALFSLDADGSGLYDDGTPVAGSWSTGEAVSVSGESGEVEDFNFEFAGPPTIPLLGADLEGASVSRAAPLSLTWEPTDAAEVFAARLYQSSTIDGNYVLLSAYCTFPASDGEGEIPSSTLDRFSNGLVGLLFGGGARTSIPGPEHAVEIFAYKADGVEMDFTD